MAWAYISHKDGYWAGIIATGAGANEVAKFLAKEARAGMEIMPVADRADYEAKLAVMKPWSDRPKPQKKPVADLFVGAP